MNKEKQIAIHCNTPLIWTFAFSHKEWYCRECGATLTMFGARGIDSTSALKKEGEKNEKWFKKIMKDYIPYGAYYKDCEQCKGNQSHLFHATDEEKKKSEKALEKLKNSREKVK